MEISQALNEAADHIERHGHRKFGLGSPGQPTCALGAIQAVTHERFSFAGVALYRYLGIDIATWNNDPDRTAAEVIEVLRACAVIEQAREEQDAAWATYAGLVTA